MLSILVVDADREMAKLVKSVLSGLGFGKIHIAHDGSDGLQVMREHPVDIVITDWHMEPVDGLNFIKYLRQSPLSPNRFVPIIMLTALGGKKHVEKARDTGANEFVVKPFTARTLVDRIIFVIENPREFVLAKGFKGPSRRRKGDAPASKEDKRKKGPPPKEIRKVEKHQVQPELADAGIVQIVQPDFDLKKKIGLQTDVKELFSADKVKRTQELINNNRNDFIVWIKKDLATMREQYRLLAYPEQNVEALIDALANTALSIKSRAGTFGYDRASEIAMSLYDFCAIPCRNEKNHLTVIKKHIDALTVIFEQDIFGDGGSKGQELLDNLLLLTKKYGR